MDDQEKVIHITNTTFSDISNDEFHYSIEKNGPLKVEMFLLLKITN